MSFLYSHTLGIGFTVRVRVRIKWASLITKILVLATEVLVTGLEIFPYEHSSPVTRIKPERLRLIHLGNRAEFHI